MLTKNSSLIGRNVEVWILMKDMEIEKESENNIFHEKLKYVQIW